MTIAKVIVLNTLQFSIGADSMSGSLSGTFAETRMLVSVALNKTDEFVLKAETLDPINLLKALSTLGMASSVDIPINVQIPAMTLTYRSKTKRFSFGSETTSSSRGDSM